MQLYNYSLNRVENVIKQLIHESAVRSSRYEALGKFGEHSRSWSCSRRTLTHLSCSPNFPRASYLDERTLTHESIVNFFFNIKILYPESSQTTWLFNSYQMRLKGNGIFLRKFSHFLSIQFHPVLPRNYSLSTHNNEKITSFPILPTEILFLKATTITYNQYIFCLCK